MVSFRYTHFIHLKKSKTSKSFDLVKKQHFYKMNFVGFIDMPELLNCMQFNYSQWKMFEEQGIHTLNDIKAKQVSLTIEKNQTSIAGTQQK